MSDANASALPDGWTRRRLRFDARINPVKSEVKLPDDAEVSFVPMDAVGELGGLRLDQTRELVDVYTGYTYFADGDVCVAKITPCFENGKGALAQGLTNGIAFGTTELHVLRPSDALDARFLFYLTIAHDFRNIGEAEMLGAGGQKRVPEAFLRDWRPLLPHIDVQHRIANFLDEKTAQIDALIEKKRALLERLAEQRQALITRAVTKGLNPNAPMKSSGVGWLGEVPVHWSLIPFKWRCRVRSGQVDPQEMPYSGLPLVAPDHIESSSGRLVDEVRSAEEQGAISGKYICFPGDVLYSKIRPSLRKVCMFDSMCLCSADMYAIDSGEEIEKEFLFYFLLTDAFSCYAELESMRVAMPKVNRDSIGAFIVPIPGKKEQSEIARKCKEIDEDEKVKSSKLKLSITTLMDYRSALITSAITGQLSELNG